MDNTQTTEQPTGEPIIYISNEATGEICQPIVWLPGSGEAPKKTAFPYVLEAPVGLSDPIYDWREAKWVESGRPNQSVVIADLTNKIVQLAEDNKELTTQVTQLQEALTEMAMSTLAPEMEVPADDTNA